MKIRDILSEQQGVAEGLGKQLATAAVAGTMAMAQPGQAQTPPQTTTATVVIDGETRTFDMGRMDVKQAAKMLEKRLDASGVTNWSATVSDGKQRANIRSVDQGIGMQNRQD